MSQVPRGNRILQAKLGNRSSERASEARSLGDRFEVRQAAGGCGGMHDARGKSFDAEAGDGRESQTAHGLRGQVDGKLGESERVNALASGRKSAGSELIGSGSGGGNQQDFSVIRLAGKEGGGALEQRGVGAGMKKRARGHRQLYWVESAGACRSIGAEGGHRVGAGRGEGWRESSNDGACDQDGGHNGDGNRI